MDRRVPKGTVLLVTASNQVHSVNCWTVVGHGFDESIPSRLVELTKADAYLHTLVKVVCTGS
jgi:hypothetical protein